MLLGVNIIRDNIIKIPNKNYDITLKIKLKKINTRRVDEYIIKMASVP